MLRATPGVHFRAVVRTREAIQRGAGGVAVTGGPTSPRRPRANFFCRGWASARRMSWAMGWRRVRERPSAASTLVSLVAKSIDRKAWAVPALLNPVHGAQRHIQGLGHLGSGPTIVALEENPRPGGHSGGAFPNANQILEFFPLFRRQPHGVLIPDHHRHPQHQHFIPSSIRLSASFLYDFQHQS